MPSELHLQNAALSLSVSSLGAEMQYLRTHDGDDLLWHGDTRFWGGRAPVLFPIVGRAVDDIIAVGDFSAKMAQHGFARRSNFTLKEQSDVMCCHVLRDTDDSRAVYPFAFTLEISHRLDGATLHVTARVENESDRVMPFGFGFHPAFCWPLPGAGTGIGAGDGDAVHHVSLASGGAPDMRRLEGGLLRRDPIPGPFVNGRLEIREELFVDDALVFPNGSDALFYGLPDGRGLEFNFTNLPDLALWRPTGAPFLCIEPWHGTAPHVGDGHQIADRPNSVALDPGQSIEFGYSVTVAL